MPKHPHTSELAVDVLAFECASRLQILPCGRSGEICSEREPCLVRLARVIAQRSGASRDSFISPRYHGESRTSRAAFLGRSGEICSEREPCLVRLARVIAQRSGALRDSFISPRYHGESRTPRAAFLGRSGEI